jgi:predicted exporter
VVHDNFYIVDHIHFVLLHIGSIIMLSCCTCVLHQARRRSKELVPMVLMMLMVTVMLIV